MSQAGCPDADLTTLRASWVWRVVALFDRLGVGLEVQPLAAQTGGNSSGRNTATPLIEVH